MLVTFFNDADKNHTSALQAEIDKLAGIETLAFKPHISCGEIDEDTENYFNEAKLVPSFSFVDPFGYKGLSLKIVNGVIKDWGCDCVFFFNYNRINAGIAGGESGPGARPMNAEWVRSIRDQCNAANVAFHFKQWGGVNKKKTGRVLDGRTWDEFPARKRNSERRPTL
jgi:three-Cys-motif partner protein